MVDMGSKQISNSVFQKVGIDSAKECGDRVGVKGKLRHSNILLTRIPAHSSLGIRFDCSVMFGQ